MIMLTINVDNVNEIMWTNFCDSVIQNNTVTIIIGDLGLAKPLK